MLAAIGEVPLVAEHLAYEPKYDGIRALVAIDPGRRAGTIRIWSRLGNDKTAQFPDVVDALAPFARRLKAPVLLDGEIVAVDETGEPTGFQELQGRMHLTRPRDIAAARAQPAALIAFDVLRDGAEDLRRLPLSTRRARLERIYGTSGSETFRLSTFVPGDGRALYRDALARGWEGLVAKRLDSPYASGRRSPAWTKLKLVGRQECVIGGWTEPRGTRALFGALLLGVWEHDGLEYIGHTGTGFTHDELTRLARRMTPLETPACPFRTRPPANERPHWVRPTLVAEVKFAEWTRDRKLRAPVYLGLRDDVPIESVTRASHTTPILGRPERPRASTASSARARQAIVGSARLLETPAPLARIIAQLEDLEARRASGTLALPDGHSVEVSHLEKILWPGPRITKGELLRHYVRVSAVILPAVADRPLVMKRFPNGIAAKAFYQQRAPARVPDGVRVAVLPSDTEVPNRLIGGSLPTLLYMAQLAVISQDPWFSRVQSPEDADQVAFDLDPMPGVPFAQVLDVARWIHDELATLGAPSVPKTSGAEGVHVYVPLPPGTSYETGRLFCQIVATIVADQHPRIATVERRVHARGRTVYIDYLQNIRGKTLATAYSARASEIAGVSAPLTWDELEHGVDRRDFTIRTMPLRLASVGDLWAPLRSSRGADLHAVQRYVERGPAATASRITSRR